MKRLFTLLILALTFAVGSYAQNEVHIVQETGTTVVNLDDVSSIDLTDEPWSSWTFVNTASYTYSLYWNGTLGGVNVYRRQNLEDQTKMQYKLTGMADNCDFVFDCNTETGECQIPVQQVTNNGNYGPVYVSDIPHYPLQPGLTYDKYPCTFNAERGLFSFNLIYFVSTDLGSGANGSFGNGVETLQLDGYYIPDYSFDIQYAGPYVDDYGNEFAAISTVKGTDVAKYLMTVVGADEDADAAIQGMLEGSVPCDALTETGLYNYSMTTSGKYRALAITFDAQEKMLGTYSVDFEFYLSSEGNPWESIGYALYTDDVVLPLFSNDPMSYYVEVLENKEQPGMFRMVDPYGPEQPLFPYASSYEYDSYIDIDATDPQGVWIEGWQSTGLDIQGLMSITSMAWYQVANSEEGATKEDAKAAGLCGTYADGVITFPVDGVLVSIDNKAYYANRNGAFALDMTNLLDSIPQGTAAARAPKAKLGRIEAIEAFEMPVKKSAGKKSNELIGVEPKVNVTLKPVPSVKFKKADASQNGLVER